MSAGLIKVAVIDVAISHVRLATIQAAIASLKPMAAASESEADRLFIDLILNKNKAERAYQANDDQAFQLQLQHASKDFS